MAGGPTPPAMMGAYRLANHTLAVGWGGIGLATTLWSGRTRAISPNLFGNDRIGSDRTGCRVSAGIETVTLFVARISGKLTRALGSGRPTLTHLALDPPRPRNHG